ncbi:hypothetical protein DL96DRAFT_1466620 [Flagelloscypha sp. PMI_526]|nr:hypothetical protein DL96DRAFT_1466620 [Flagelloscypha sp. PMI_526]
MPGTIPLGPGHYAHSPGGQSWKPGTFPPQDPNMSVPLQLHPKLLYNPVNPGLPVLEWDLALSPPTALSVTGRHCYVKPDLKVSAVSPDVQTIHIESDEPLLQGWMQRWGPIIVNNNDKVTMGDVMWTIYDYLQKPLTNEDKELIKERDRNSVEGTRDWHSLEYARHIRCQEGYGLYRVASQEDFKRVDALGGLRRFKGLRFVVFGTNQWKAYLGLLEGPLYVVKPA